MKTTFIFTGQGFQYPGMLNELLDNPNSTNLFELASDVLGENVLNLDSAEGLANNRNVQLCIYIREVILGLLEMEKVKPDFVAGHSIGTFAAATISGTLDYKDGLCLVNERGKAMAQSYPTGYSMLSFTGLSLGILEKEIINQNDIYISIINSQEQIVLSGSIIRLEEFEKKIKIKYPAKTNFLKVNVPSHCELMENVSSLLKDKINKIDLKEPLIPYIMNTTARKTKKSDDIIKDLVYGVSKRVNWYDSISILYEMGVEKFIEISGSDTLSKIGKKEFKNVQWKAGGL